MDTERKPLLVETQDALVAAAAMLAGRERLALDVEADGYFRYRARLCVLQLAAEGDVVIVDTLAVRDLSPLAPLLGAHGPLKLVHDAAFDARLLFEAGITLGGVLDTSVCARFLGEAQSGLASLLEKKLGMTLKKEKQMHDWGQRPFAAEELAYLAADVAHLPALAELLLADAAARDVLPAIEEESRWVLARAFEPPAAPPPPWTRLKGAQAMPPVQRAILRETCLVREEVARERDVPPFRVVVNDVLLVVAKRQPRSLHSFSHIAPRVAGDRALAAALVDAVGRGIAAGDAPEAERARPPALPPAEREVRRARERALTDWRKKEAAARGIDPQAVLPGHCLAELVATAPANLAALATVGGLGVFRVARDGEALLACLVPPPPPPPAPPAAPG